MPLRIITYCLMSDMMEEPKDLIMGQLLQAGEPSPLTPDVIQLLQRRITPETSLPSMQFLFRMFGVPCFPRGELVVVAGKAKSGKTLFLSLLMAASMKQKILALERNTDESPLRVMWYDTEQSEQSTQDILVNRIYPLACPEDGNESLFAFNLRCKSWEERLQLFSAGVAYLKPDLVVLDGVRDLLADINDGVEAQRITEMLMTLAQTHQCCIVCVLHQNKSDSDHTLRGWIGTELTNKVFEVYTCEKLKGYATFKVKQEHTRKHDIDRELYYTIDSDTGLPEACAKPQEQPRDAQGRWMSPRQNPTPSEKWEMLNQKYITRHPEDAKQPWEWNVRRLFSDAFAGKDVLPYNTLMGIALGLSHINDKDQYYAAYRKAISENVIREVRHPSTGQQMVMLANSRLEFEDAPF